jgi:hypothetical protein
VASSKFGSRCPSPEETLQPEQIVEDELIYRDGSESLMGSCGARSAGDLSAEGSEERSEERSGSVEEEGNEGEERENEKQNQNDNENNNSSPLQQQSTAQTPLENSEKAVKEVPLAFAHEINGKSETPLLEPVDSKVVSMQEKAQEESTSPVGADYSATVSAVSDDEDPECEAPGEDHEL